MQLSTNSPKNYRLEKIAALNLSARYLAAQQICKYTVSDMYLGSLQLISNTNAKSDGYSTMLKAQVVESRNRVKKKQEELSIEEGCEFYKTQVNNDIEAHLSNLYSNKSTSDIQDKGLFEITRALQARDACGYKTSLNAKFNKAHNLDTSDFSKEGVHLSMFFYHAIQVGLNMNKVGRSLWCKEVNASSKLLVTQTQ